MPVIQTVLPQGNINVRRGKGGSLTISQDWPYRILADSVNQDRVAIATSTTGVPKFGQLYGGYGLILESISGERHPDHPLLWDITFTLSNNVEEGDNQDQETGEDQTGDPTEWVPWVELGFEDYEEVLRESLTIENAEKHPDIGGSDSAGYSATKWLNSAGQPYESGFVRQKRIVTRKFTQFEKASGGGALTLDAIENRNDVLNNATYLGRPKRTLKLSVDSCAIGTYYGFRCWRVDYTIAYKKDDWRLKQLDVGWYYKEGDDLVPFEDANGNPILGSLNGQGGKASDQSDPALRYHKEFPEVNFSSILRLS